MPYDLDVKLSIAPYRLSDLTCILCERKFNYFSKLISHVNNDHPTQAFVCVQCKQSFNKKRDLDAHFRIKHRKKPCTTRLRNLPSSKHLDHKTHSQTSKCNVCFKSFLTFTACFDHIKNDHAETKLKCGLCCNFEATKKTFLKHVVKCKENFKDISNDMANDANKKASVTQIRNNLACIFNNSTAVPFKYFMSKFRCFYCTKDFDECDDLKQHTIIEHPICDTKLKSMKLRHRNDGLVKVDVSSLSCKICFENFQDLNILIEHLHCEHKINFDKALMFNLQPFKLIKDNYPCPFCGEVYTYFRTLLHHVTKLHSDNKNICVSCGMSFRNAPNLRTHIARHHKTANYKCSKCDLRFSTNNYLRTHLGRVHGIKVVECQQCNEKFPSNYEIHRHRIQVHRTGHKCSVCHKLFVGKSCVRNHMRRTHLKEKDVTCNVCREKFFDGHSLKVHMVKHCGERNFQCDVCGKKFLWKKNLRGHMTSHNEGPSEYTVEERRRKNLQIIFNNTTIMPFNWRGKYSCFYCGQNHTEYPLFRKHTKSHGLCSTSDYALASDSKSIEIMIDTSDILCEICYEPFPSFDEIIDHLIVKHELGYDKGIYTHFQEYRLVDCRCRLCGDKFANFGNLISHTSIFHAEKSFICDNCGEKFDKKTGLKTHIRHYHQDGGYPCEDCSEKFETLILLQTHKNHYHLKKCEICASRFASLNLLRKHVKCEHPNNGSGMECPHCSKKYSRTQGLFQHIRKCHSKTQITTKKVVYPNEKLPPPKKRNILQMRRNVQCVLNMSTAVPFKFFVKFSCFYCSKYFVEFDELKAHAKAEHPICDLKDKCMKNFKGDRITCKVDISSLACKVCDEPMNDLDRLIDHIISKHSANYDKSATDCFEPFKIMKDNVPCPICGNVFRYFSTLLRHINSEHSNNNKICDFCGKSFKRVTNLKMHISNTHTGSCECEICGVTYKNQWCLGRHKAKCHDAKEFQCTKCPEKFQSQYHKQKHLIDVHDTGHKCTFCGKMFTRNSFMKDHIRRTHLKERNVACTICNGKFFDNYLLKLHMVKHKGERNFSCDICGKTFLRRRNLKRHTEMHEKYSQV